MYGTVTVVFKAFATIFVIILHYCCMYSIIKFTCWWNIKKTWFLCSLSMCFNTLSMCFINLTDLFFFTFFSQYFFIFFLFPPPFFSLWQLKKISRSPLIPLKKFRVPPSFRKNNFAFPPKFYHSPPGVNNDRSLTLGDFTAKKRKIGKGNLSLTENRLSRNEMWCVSDNHNYMCHTCAKELLDSNFN